MATIIEEPCCNNCLNYRLSIGRDGRPVLNTRECKLAPPDIYPVGTNDKGEPVFVNVRPGPPPSDWCRKWESKHG